jgi:uncharacterized protein
LTAALNVALTGERRRDNGQTLIGSRCERCGAASFPARAVCHRCGTAAPAEEAFAPTGTLITYTTVHVERPGMPVPYTLGQIAIEGSGPLVFGQVRVPDDELVAGLAVRVVVGGAGEVPRYWFVPA